MSLLSPRTGIYLPYYKSPTSVLSSTDTNCDYVYMSFINVFLRITRLIPIPILMSKPPFLSSTCYNRVTMNISLTSPISVLIHKRRCPILFFQLGSFLSFSSSLTLFLYIFGFYLHSSLNILFPTVVQCIMSIRSFEFFIMFIIMTYIGSNLQFTLFQNIGYKSQMKHL